MDLQSIQAVGALGIASTLSSVDILVFLGFIGSVIAFCMYKSRKIKGEESNSEDYFLAGRGATWWLIGFSLIAANISTEQFVGMSGSAAGNVGMAIASYEWMAAVTLVVVAIFFLPRFLSAGIYTIPEYLEYRYNPFTRAVMAFLMMITYITVTISAVVYSGGLTLHKIFDLDLTMGVWIIGTLAALYTTFGGLKAIIWADLFMGSGLIIGGAIVLYLGLDKVGGWAHFADVNADKLHMILPADHPTLPWTALIVGLWLPNFYYWGLNQYITQRTLAAKSLTAGQLGIMFAAFLKLIIPFVIVIPGIMAWQLYAEDMTDTTDGAYPIMIRKLITLNGLKGFMLAALAGAVLSSLSSMLNSAATIATMDIYKRHINKQANQKSLIVMGRALTIIFVVVGCVIAPQLSNPKFKGIFNFIQEMQGFISPGILAAFVFGFAVKRAPALAGTLALITSPIFYTLLMFLPFTKDIAFLNRMAISFGLVLLTMTITTIANPLAQPVVMPKNETLDLRSSPVAKVLGVIIIVLTACLYAYFW